MDLSLHQLRIFAAVVEMQSFSRAAESLLLTQPAVSMQVKAVERVVGMPLLEHVGKRFELTEAGRELYSRATEVLGLMDETVTAMVDLREGRRGRLRLVATTTVGIYVVPTLLGDFHRRHPQIEVRLEVANWERTVDRLFSHHADVAIAGSHPQPGLEMVPFMDDELVVIAAVGHHLAGRRVNLEELAREPILVREIGSGTRAAVEHLFAQHDIPLRPAMELSRNGAIKQVAKAGLGVAVISHGALALELATGALCLLDVEGFPIVRSWNIITRSGTSLPPAAVLFSGELRERVTS